MIKIEKRMIMKIKKEICQNIFRGYDIRGIYEKEIDEDTAYTIGLGFGTIMLA